MRAVIQRVSQASVSVDGETISKIGRGIMVLVGIGTDDNKTDMEYICKKILTLRIFDSPDGGQMWKSSVKDISGEVLCVSQFTLMANTTKEDIDSETQIQATEPSRAVYAEFLERMRQLYQPEKIQDGRFGAMMNVSLTNDGPVTITVDSRKFEYVPVETASAPPAKSVMKKAKAAILASDTPSSSVSEQQDAVPNIIERTS